jgi:hypothetical protein
MEALLTGAGFTTESIRPQSRSIRLPSAREFMWQYIYCTPLMAVVPQMDRARTEALEHEVAAGWQPWSSGDGMQFDSAILVSAAHR